jgi:hypothetical protein
MTEQSQSPAPSGSDQPSGFSVEAFGAKFALWGKHTLWVLIIGFGFYLVFQTEANEFYKKTFNKAEYEQKKKFYLQHEFISPIIDAWDNIHDIEDMSKKSVKKVREGIDDAIFRYESLKVDKLSMATQVTWQYHLARLKVIEADKYSKINSLEVAIHWLNEAKSNSNKTELLTPDDMKFINNIRMNTRIKRTLLNAYALSFHITQDVKYSHLASEVLKDIGGCRELDSTYFYHKKIAKTLSCKI